MNKTVGLIYKSIVIDEVFIARIIRRIYKNAVFDTNRKSLLRHISAEKGLKQRAFEVPLCFTAELRKPFFCVFDCCWPVLRPLKLTPQSHLPEE